MRLVLALLLAPLAMTGQEGGTVFRSGPFEVYSKGSDRAAREALNRLEQFRHTLGRTLGKDDMGTLWPVRVLVSRAGGHSGIRLARDAYVLALAGGGPLGENTQRDLARILIESNAGRMPAGIESGLASLFSTLQVAGTRVTLGAPPPGASGDRDWARMHLLAVDPEYSGKLRVMLVNLQQGADLEPACRNAFGKNPEEIERQAGAYLAAGRFGTTLLSGRPIDPDRDFRALPADASPARALPADVAGTEEAYRKLGASAEAEEGLALLALEAGRVEEAKQRFQAAVKAGSASARALAGQGRLSGDRQALERAAKANPRWAEPLFLLGQSEPDGKKKLELLGGAARLAPRESRLWRTLAECQESQNLFGEAAKSWLAAERAAATPEERASLVRIRRENAEKRAAFEAAEKKRLAEERERELQRLRDEAMNRIRMAEARANKGNSPRTDEKVEPWWEGPAPGGKARGRLLRVDCLRGITRLVVAGDDGKTTQLAVRDPSKIVVTGKGEASLGCGPQKPARRVLVEYFPKPDAKLGTAGDAATVEFLE